MKYLVYSTCLILLFTLFENQIQAQIWLSNEDIYNEADKFLNSEDYEEALPLFLLLEKKDFKTPNIGYKIGTCYLNSRGKKSKAIPYLEYAVTSITRNYGNNLQEKKAPLKSLLMLGIAYRINNQPNKAIEIFEMLKDSVADTDSELRNLADLHIKRCENALVLQDFPGDPVKERLPDTINNEFANFNPVIVNKGNILYYMESMKFYDAIKETELNNGQWQTPKDITPDLHSDGDHYLASASADGNMLILYLYEPLKAGELYYTIKTSDGWSQQIPFNENINTKYHETHASLSSDGSTLFFTSNRPGGIGGLDIYMSVKDENNNWGPAVNLGPDINTPYDEETPFISSNDSVLYFSSQGHLNIGGYDVFYSKRKGFNSWSMPINMGVPVSTADDDLFYYPMENGLHGLMSRIENNFYPSYDIYKYKYIDFPNTPRYRVRGRISDSANVQNGDITIFVIDKSTGDTVQKAKPDGNGNYELLLPNGNFFVSIAGQSGTLAGSDLSLNNGTDEIIEMPTGEKVSGVEKTIAAVIETKNDTLIIKDVLFAFNNCDLQSQSKEYLQEIVNRLKNDHNMQLQIIGYADAIGNENYNLELSRKRAISVENYFISNNIEKNRLSISGKGESDPVAINANSDGTDNPEGRQYNRRVVILPVNYPTNLILIKLVDIPFDLRIK